MVATQHHKCRHDTTRLDLWVSRAKACDEGRELRGQVGARELRSPGVVSSRNHANQPLGAGVLFRGIKLIKPVTSEMSLRFQTPLHSSSSPGCRDRSGLLRTGAPGRSGRLEQLHSELTQRHRLGWRVMMLWLLHHGKEGPSCPTVLIANT